MAISPLRSNSTQTTTSSMGRLGSDDYSRTGIARTEGSSFGAPDRRYVNAFSPSHTPDGKTEIKRDPVGFLGNQRSFDSTNSPSYYTSPFSPGSASSQQSVGYNLNGPTSGVTPTPTTPGVTPAPTTPGVTPAPATPGVAPAPTTPGGPVAPASATPENKVQYSKFNTPQMEQYRLEAEKRTNELIQQQAAQEQARKDALQRQQEERDALARKIAEREERQAMFQANQDQMTQLTEALSGFGQARPKRQRFAPAWEKPGWRTNFDS